MERHRAQIEQKERIAEEFRKNLSLSKEEAAQTLALTLTLTLSLARRAASLRSGCSSRSRSSRR